METSLSLILTVLAALLTGGFLMLTIENVHLSASVFDRYYSIMKPFFHKLTCYSRFMEYTKFHIRYNVAVSEYVKDAKRLIEEVSIPGDETIMTGLDIPVSKYSAKELETFCMCKINKIWALLIEKKNEIGDGLMFDESRIDEIERELLEGISEKYKGKTINLDFIGNLSGEFYTDIYQPIHFVPYQFEWWQRMERRFRLLNVVSVTANLLSILLIALLNRCLSNCTCSIILLTNTLLFAGLYILYVVLDKRSRNIIRV